ncbi:replicative DNA helicase [Acuticoccus kandeliae]|uniref:replicative DNA helicase n=1 Tax=Acuticoccus kandeliae TaxID=2073160 RepID=UPI000D3EA400|nr:DnaB-like helicase C-terminal domain-containing protein [Acuticoccus kandeliae]
MISVEAPSAEKDLVGHLLLNPDAHDDIAERLKPKHFASELMGGIYEAIGAVRAKGNSWGLSLVEASCRAELKGDITLRAYLPVLMARNTMGMTAKDLADKILDPFLRNQWLDIAAKLPALANDRDIPGDDLPERGMALLHGVYNAEPVKEIATVGELSARLMERIDAAQSGTVKVQGLYSGFRSLDELIAPLMPGRLIVVGGATSMGKSALAQRLVWGVASSGHPVHLVTNEMTNDEAMERFAAQLARVDSRRILTGSLNAAERDRLFDALARVRSWPITVDDSEGQSAANVRLRTQRLIRQRGLKLLVIDHLQFLEPMNKKAKEYEAIAETTRELKKIAKALNIPVVLVSHVNRGFDADVKTAKDIRLPQLRDLHGSSSIEKDADTVLFVHRPIYYLSRAEPSVSAKHYPEWAVDRENWEGRAELIKAKMRGGVGFARRRVLYRDAFTLCEDEEVERTQSMML